MNARSAILALGALSLVCPFAASAATWQTGTYVYDGAGNLQSIGGAAEVYQYDAFGRMTYGKIATGQTQSATYDPYGNLLTLTTNGTQLSFGVNAQTNRMTVPANVYANYDDAGRLISTPSGSDAFAYDAADSITRSNISGDTRIHIYSASDERLATLVPNGPENSQWTIRDVDGRVLRRVDRYSTSWTWKEDYVYVGSILLASEVDSSQERLFFFPDHLGTPRLITGNGAMKVSFHTYYPFGTEATPGGQDAEKKQFTGHERDHESLDYMHARYYRPQWGRFLSVDPMLDVKKSTTTPQLWNRYAYVTNNPVRYTDDDGRECGGCAAFERDVRLLQAGRISVSEYNARNKARAAGTGAGLLTLGALYLATHGRPAIGPALGELGVAIAVRFPSAFNLVQNFLAAETGTPLPTIGGFQAAFSAVEKAELTAAKFGMSADDLVKATVQNGGQFVDQTHGTINVFMARPDGKAGFVRVTLDAAKKIVSVGLVSDANVRNGIREGRFVPLTY